MISKIYRASRSIHHLERRVYGTAPGVDEIYRTARKCLIFDKKEGCIVKSPYKPIELTQTTVDRHIWQNISKWSDHIAIECGYTGRKYSYSMLRDYCSALAIRLRNNMKLVNGDLVAICLPNIPEYPIVLLGSLESGLAVTTINPSSTEDELSQQLSNCRPRIIFCALENYAAVKRSIQSAKLDDIKIVALKTNSDDTYPANVIQFDDLISINGLNLSESSKFNDQADVNEMILLPYSSGTTGLQKGVKHSHSTTIANSQILSNKIRNDSLISSATADFQEVVPCFLPFYHIYGLTVLLLNTLSMGCKIVTMPKYQPDKFLDILLKHKATFLPLVPPVVIQLNNFAAANPVYFQYVRTIMSGASSLLEADVDKFLTKNVPKGKFVQGYGMTEGVFTLAPKEIDAYGTVGWPLSNTEVKIARLDDPTFQGVPAQEVGELLARGSTVMNGYFENKEATNSTIINGGWIRTGDLAYYDENGLFYICDRLKELIKVNAYQVAPAELEGILREHINILDAAVIGIPNEITGEIPKAFIVRRPGSSLNELQIQEFVAKRVSSHKHLMGGIQFIEMIPKSASGKILRREIKRLYC